MKIRLALADPHPEHSAMPFDIAEWFGRVIEIGAPIIPRDRMPCGTHTLWLITGPPAFLETLGDYKRVGRYICIHQIGEVLHEDHDAEPYELPQSPEDAAQA